MSFQKIKASIESGKFAPVYFFSGEEGFYIDALMDLIMQKVLTEAQRDFNQHLFYARDSDPQDIINTARRYPVFADRQLVVVREAQEYNKAKSSWDKFVPYIAQPVQSTVLVFSHKHKSLDKRSKFAKTLKNSGAVLFEAKKVGEDKIPGWISDHLKEHGYRIDQKSSFLLKEHLGNDLSKIANELKKLMMNLKGQSSINAGHIEEFIGISKDFNAFEFSKAVSSKDYLKTMKIIHYFEQNPKAGPIVFILALLFNYFSKLYQLHTLSGLPDREASKAVGISPYFFGEYKTGLRSYPMHKTETILSDIANTDAKSKGIGNVSIGPYELLKELVYRTMH